MPSSVTSLASDLSSLNIRFASLILRMYGFWCIHRFYNSSLSRFVTLNSAHNAAHFNIRWTWLQIRSNLLMGWYLGPYKECGG